MTTALKSELKELMDEKDKLESELKALQEVLDSQKGVGMDSPLVDQEGFPLADVDIYSVRHARHRIICLQNDHKALMKKIEEGLHNLHAKVREEKGANEQMEVDATPSGPSTDSSRIPFATVDRVDAGSPANQAGLEVGDEILEFGSITTSNFQSLKNIGEVVQHGKDRPLSVAVLRTGSEVRLFLIPHTWSGRGLLGCNIVPRKT